MKRYILYLEHFNDASEVVFESDKIEEALRMIADDVENVEYPKDIDNTDNSLYCYRLYDGLKTENDGEGNMLPSEIFCTDYFLG